MQTEFTCVGCAWMPHLSSGHFSRLIEPSVMCTSKYSLRQALQKTCSHPQNCIHALPGFSQRQTWQENIVLANTRSRLVRSYSRTIGRLCSLRSKGDLMSRKAIASVCRNPIHVKSITDPQLSTHNFWSWVVKSDNCNATKRSKHLYSVFKVFYMRLWTKLWTTLQCWK